MIVRFIFEDKLSGFQETGLMIVVISHIVLCSCLPCFLIRSAEARIEPLEINIRNEPKTTTNDKRTVSFQYHDPAQDFDADFGVEMTDLEEGPI